MSINLAQAWVERTLRNAPARKDACQLFENASVEGKHATLIASPQLTTNGKGWLARWTGNELVVLELSESQQGSLGVTPGAMCRQLESNAVRAELSAERWVTLFSAEIDSADHYDGRSPLQGKLTLALDETAPWPLQGCALQVEYFRPDLPRHVTAYWHANDAIRPGRCELRFSFPPVVSPKNPVGTSGTLVLFLQMFTAKDWGKLQGCRSISNVTTAIVNLAV